MPLKRARAVPEEAKREAERALALVDPGGLGDYEADGSFATLYSGEGFLLELAKLEGRLVVAAAWGVGRGVHRRRGERVAHYYGAQLTR